MKKHIGLWVDHRKAVIAMDSEAGGEIKVILSHADRQPGRINGKRSGEPFESLLVPADDVKDRKFIQHLHTYYDEVISIIHHATALLIFGPGEAKFELERRLAHEKPTRRRVNVEPADKMTERQIAATVRRHFQEEKAATVMK